MTVLKCKMCGGNIEIDESMSIGKCLYCDSLMTIPRIDSDKKTRLFNRANQYRINCEFDKAYDAYKSIIDEDEREAEAYWGLILSEYGVEYIEDPATHKRVPTCHRTKVQSILNSTNYLLACQYANAESKMMYQDEAEELDKLQRKILSVTEKAEAYDVFICYKETEDESGERTKDSVLAQNIYDELTKQGVKTFFSRISLEDKLGQNYEPYIYSALVSSRVMLVVSTSGSHCDAVWVKNEWMRFLSFMEENSDKTLIPVYQDMSVYEFPNELSGFQAQDMAKVGAIQDLVYGVKKILGSSKKEQDNEILQTLIKEKQESDIRKQRVASVTKNVVKISVALILIALLCFGGFILYKNVIRPWTIYNSAQEAINAENYAEAIVSLEQIPDYSDSSDLVVQCKYSYGVQLVAQKEYESAIQQFEEIVDYYDCSEQIVNAKHLYGMHLMEQSEYEKAIAKFEEILNHPKSQEMINECTYQMALVQMENEDYNAAINIFKTIPDYKDSAGKIIESRYNLALAQMESGQYETAITVLKSIISYENSSELISECKYQQALEAKEAGSSTTALNILEEISGYKDSAELIVELKYNSATNLKVSQKYLEAAEIFQEIIDYSDSQEKYVECMYYAGKTGLDAGRYMSRYIDYVMVAVDANYEGSKEYLDSIFKKIYKYAESELAKYSFDEAKEYFGLLADYSYKDSKKRYDATVATEMAPLKAIAGKWYGTDSWRWGQYLYATANGAFGYSPSEDEPDYSDYYIYDYAAGIYVINTGWDAYYATITDNTIFLVWAKSVRTGEDEETWPVAGFYTKVSD